MTRTTTATLELRVAEAATKDVGRGLARLEAGPRTHPSGYDDEPP